jgi:RimJ/RimL family protein N-acetyltransferase
MKIVCSWCRKEGKAEFVGEKAPLDDARETHGICGLHRDQVQAHWRASLQAARGIGIMTESASALLRWTGLLSLTKKMRH